MLGFASSGIHGWGLPVALVGGVLLLTVAVLQTFAPQESPVWRRVLIGLGLLVVLVGLSRWAIVLIAGLFFATPV